MAAVLPTVMNSLDDAPRVASIAPSHTDGGWKLVLVGEQRRYTNACTFCGHIWMQGSAHMYILRERERVCPCVFVCAWGSVCLLTPADARCSLDRG